MAVMENLSMQKFDHKIFNEVAFGKYIDQLPRIRENRLLKSGVLIQDGTLNTLLSEQTGSYKANIPIYDRTVQNYDGNTNITFNTTKTFHQVVIALGRVSEFVEKDFAYDITGGTPFFETMASQLNDYWDDVMEDDLISTLQGIFAENASDIEKTKFIKEHTHDISASAKDNKVSVTTLNYAIQKVCGDKKDGFKVVVMHSQVATTLENLKLLEHYKYTDPYGMERDLTFATWNGREVVITDTGTFENDKYISYVLGKGAIKFSQLGVRVPNEMVRDAKTNGGETTLISRRRYVFAPIGLSFIGNKISPMPTDLKNGANWTIVGDGDKPANEVFPHKAIPIARIITKG